MSSVDQQLAAGLHVGPEGATIAERFREFDDANPHVYRELVKLARTWVRRRGQRRLGVSMLYEVMRWNLALETRDEPFKLNNNSRALYARKMMAHEPDLAGLFETRKLDEDCQCRACHVARARRHIGAGQTALL